MTQTTSAPRLVYHIAPRLTHATVAGMTDAQKEKALHEFIDLHDTMKRTIFTPQASPQTRIFALATIVERTQKTARGRLADVTEQAPIWIGDQDKEGSLACRIGISRNSISNELTAGEKAGLFKRFYRKDDQGNEHLDLSIAPDLFTESASLPCKGERPRRPPVTCPSPTCGSTDIRRKTHYVCADCGTVFNQTETEVNHDEVEDAPIYPNTPPAVVDSSLVEPTEQTQQSLCTRDVQYVYGEDCTRDVHNVEEDAAQLLLDLAGPTHQHIEMSNGHPGRFGERKYITFDSALTLEDTRAHIRGEKTIGDSLKHADGLTRATCHDADNPHDWQKLQEAARLLACVGFSPLLEPNPMEGGKHAGGGRMWNVMDGLVDGYSLIQTEYQYAPILKEIKECWPGLNTPTRLPGGKYLQGNLAKWCKLYDAYGNELSHEGAGAAAVLLASQTSTDLVNEYTPPEPEPPIAPRRDTRAAGGVLGKDVAPQVTAQFNAITSWDELARMAGGYDKRGYFPACWRGNKPPYDVHVDPKTDLAKDFGASAWIDKPMDKHQVYCLIVGRENWQSFKKLDLARRCRELRG